MDGHISWRGTLDGLLDIVRGPILKSRLLYRGCGRRDGVSMTSNGIDGS